MIVSWDVQITILLDRAFIHAGSSENQHELFSSRLQIHEAPKPQTWPKNHMRGSLWMWIFLEPKIDQFQRTALCLSLPSNWIHQEGHGSKFSNQQNRKSFMPIRSRFIHMY